MNVIKTHTRYKLGRASGSTPVWEGKWYQNDVLSGLETAYATKYNFLEQIILGTSNAPNTEATVTIQGSMVGGAVIADLNLNNGDQWDYDFGTTSITVTTRRLIKITSTLDNVSIKEICIPNVSRATIPDNEANTVRLGETIFLLVELVYELFKQNPTNVVVLAYNDAANDTEGFLKRIIPITRILHRPIPTSNEPKDNYGVPNSSLQPIGIYTTNISALTVDNLPEGPNLYKHSSLAINNEWDSTLPSINVALNDSQLTSSYAISFLDYRLNIESILDFGNTPINFLENGGAVRILADVPLSDHHVLPTTYPNSMQFVGFSGYGLSILGTNGIASFSDYPKVRKVDWDGSTVSNGGTATNFSGEFTTPDPVVFRSTLDSQGRTDWLRAINSWGDLNYTGIELAHSYLTRMPATLPTMLTNGDRLFKLARLSTIATAIGDLNVSNLNTMEEMFANARFSADLNLGSWNVANVTNMKGMFLGWSPLTPTSKVTGLENWNVANVLDMSDMFNATASNIYTPLPTTNVNLLANWDVGKVMNMDRMFANTPLTLTLNIRDWCVSNVNTIPVDFAPAGSYLANIDNQPLWGFCPRTDIVVEVDTGNFTLTTNDATKGQQVKIDGVWHDIESLTYPITVTSKKNIGIRMGTSTTGTEVNLSGTAPRRILSLAKQPTNNNVGANIKFGGCTSLTACLPDLPTWITNTSGMFEGCTSLVSTGIISTGNVTNMASMFSGCTNFDGVGLDVWDVSKVTNMASMFYGITNNSFNPVLTTWDVGLVTNMSNMFRGVKGFGGSIIGWNVVNVTNFSYMFAECPTFNQAIGGWNVAKATTIEGMFYNTPLFDQPLNTWNTVAVTNMASVFQGASGFDQPLDNWKFALVTTMADMFNGAESFNQNLHYIDTSAVMNMDRMFKGATAFDQDIALWCVYNITTVPTEFALGCPTPVELQPMWGFYPGRDFIVKTKPTTDLNMVLYNGESYRVGLGAWVPISGLQYGSASFTLPANSTVSIKINKRTRNSQIFYLASGLQELVSMAPFYNYGAQLNFSQATGLQVVSARLNYYLRDLSLMFSRCSQLTEVKFKIPNSINKTTSMFNFCSALTTIPADWDMSNVTDMSYMFQNCLAFNSPSVSNWVFGASPKIEGIFSGCSAFNQNVNNWNVSGVTSFLRVFQNCNNFDQPLNNWNVGSGTTFTAMFNGCSKFNQNIESWNMSNALVLNQMLKGCTLFNQPVNGWDVSKVTNPQELFSACTNFNQPLNSWNTAAFTTLRQTFEACTSFNQPLNMWNIGNVTQLYYTFYNASSFNQDLNNWNTVKVTNLTSTFHGCSSFNGDISTWNTSLVTTLANTFNSCINFNQPLNSWDVSKVTSMLSTFLSCVAFNQSLSNWNTALVTTMSNTFNGCNSFNQDISMWDVSKVTVMTSMFGSCAAFNYPLNNWNVAKCRDFRNMFEGASSFNQPLNLWDMTEARYVTYMFYNASSFKQDLYVWKNTIFTHVNLRPGFFYNGSRLELWDTPWSDGLVPTFKILLDSKYYSADNNWWYELDVYYEGGKVARSSTNSTLLTEGVVNTVRFGSFASSQRPPAEYTLFTNRREIGTAPTKLIINGVNLLEVRDWEYELDSSDLTTISFKDSPNLTLLPATLRPDLVNLESLVENCPNMTSDITVWDVGNVTNLKNAFKNNPDFNQDISVWDVGSVQNFYGMLEGCTNFNKPIGSWNTASATLMTALFKNAINFSQDISEWDVGLVTNMDEMFLNVAYYGYDLSLWCVTNIPSLPTDFATGSNFPTSHYPQWGTCMFRVFDQENDLVLEHGGTGNIDIYLYSGDKYTYNSVTTTVASSGLVSFTSAGIYKFDIQPRSGLKVPISGTGLKRVINWPYTKNIGIGYTFIGASNLIYVPAFLPFYIEDCVQMFDGCTNMNRDIGDWEMSMITSLNAMFRNCTNFNQYIGLWNVPNVTNMDSFLDNAINFSQDLSQWCVTNITAEPTNFNTNGILTAGQKPVWGTCPTEA